MLYRNLFFFFFFFTQGLLTVEQTTAADHAVHSAVRTHEQSSVRNSRSNVHITRSCGVFGQPGLAVGSSGFLLRMCATYTAVKNVLKATSFRRQPNILRSSHVHCPMSLSDLEQISIFSTYSHICPRYQIS